MSIVSYNHPNPLKINFLESVFITKLPQYFSAMVVAPAQNGRHGLHMVADSSLLVFITAIIIITFTIR